MGKAEEEVNRTSTNMGHVLKRRRKRKLLFRLAMPEKGRERERTSIASSMRDFFFLG